MGNAELGQPFNFQYESKSMYSDPEFRSLFMVVKADIIVSHPNREGGEKSAKYVTSIVNMEIDDQLRSIGDKQVPYSDLQAYIPNITNACCVKLTEEGYNVISFNITSLDLAPEIKESVERMKMMKTMTSEDIGRQAFEAEQAAMQAAAQMGVPTPDPGTVPPGWAIAPGPGTIPQMPIQPQEQAQGFVPAMDTPPAQPYPKFCPNCGTPTTGTNFCANCGQKLKY